MKSVDDTTQLCTVGDIFYRVSKMAKENILYVEPITITKAEFVEGFSDYNGHWYYRDNKSRSYFNRNIRESCFKTLEEAEKEIQKRKNVIKKRELLRKYEQKLNEELNLKDHYIVK